MKIAKTIYVEHEEIRQNTAGERYISVPLDNGERVVVVLPRLSAVELVAARKMAVTRREALAAWDAEYGKAG